MKRCAGLTILQFPLQIPAPTLKMTQQEDAGCQAYNEPKDTKYANVPKKPTTALAVPPCGPHGLTALQICARQCHRFYVFCSQLAGAGTRADLFPLISRSWPSTIPHPILHLSLKRIVTTMAQKTPVQSQNILRQKSPFSVKYRFPFGTSNMKLA